MKTKTKRKRPLRFPDIGVHARQLGVSREHLYLVLTGQRESRSLAQRYINLIESKLKDSVCQPTR